MEIDRLSTKSIRKKVTPILNSLPNNSAPIILNEVVTHLKNQGLDFHFEAKDLSRSVSGLFIKSGQQVGILYNKKHPEVRQRFTVAHELGHLVLEHNFDVQQHTEKIKLDSSNPIEIEANIFASELLMPFQMLKEDCKDNDVKIPDLARKYSVSEEAMGWRLFNSDALLLSA